jgi:hypothetical protein
MRRNPYQHVNVFSIDSARIDCELKTPRNLSQQFSRSLANVTRKHWISVLCDPHEMVLAVPNCVAPLLVVFHALTVSHLSRRFRRLKARGLRIPEGGTLKKNTWRHPPERGRRRNRNAHRWRRRRLGLRGYRRRGKAFSAAGRCTGGRTTHQLRHVGSPGASASLYMRGICTLCGAPSKDL